MRGVPVLLLCGGQGIWIDGSGHRVVKPLVPVAGTPLVLHVIAAYRSSGAAHFVLAAGLQHQALDLAFAARAVSREGRAYVLADADGPYTVEVVDTGVDTPTADRVRACVPQLGDAETVALHYSDVLSTVDLSAVVAFHRQHGRLATMVGARMPIRFRIVGVRAGETTVRGFASRPVVPSSWINGGYYLLQREVLGGSWLDEAVHALEDDLLAKLASAGQLEMFPFEGDWQFLDSERNLAALTAIVEATAR